MSNVYKVWNPQLETFRAVKLMKPDISMDSRQRFQTEMKIMAALSHPNIIEIHSVGEWKGLSFIEMEYIEGFTLAEIIEKKGALPPPVCTAICIMIARALIFAHTRDYVLFGKTYHGIIHRDLKPSNLMAAKDGKIKLMDFGIARPVESSLMTMDGAVMGTMQYLAPEQIDGKNVGIGADIYALGVVCYEMLTGCKTFPQTNLSQLMAAKTEHAFVPLKAFKANIAPKLKTLVSNCMLHDLRKRVPSAAAALSEFEHIHRGLTIDSPEEVVASLLSSPINDKTVFIVRKPLPIRIVAGIAAILIFIIAVALVTASRHRVRGRTLAATASTHAPSKAPTTASDSVLKTAPPSVAMTAANTVSPNGANVDRVPVKHASQLSKESNKVLSASVESFEKEMESGSFENALQLFVQLPPEAVAQKNAQLLRLRALYGLGRTAEAEDVINSQTIDDGEYYLIKAKCLVRRGDCDEVMSILEKSIAVRSRNLDADVVRRDYLYCRAKCLSRRFDTEASQENRKAALDGWFEVKNAVRRFPHHMYFNEAVSEMQRIGAVSRSPERVQGKKGTMP
jgi:serine/threonine protein kinase